MRANSAINIYVRALRYETQANILHVKLIFYAGNTCTVKYFTVNIIYIKVSNIPYSHTVQNNIIEFVYYSNTRSFLTQSYALQ